MTVGTLFGFVAIGAVLPVLPGYVKGTLGYGDFAVGIVIGCYAISGLLLRPVAGRFADRLGRKLTALVGSALLMGGGLLYLPPLGLAGLIVARLIIGAGEGFLYTAGSAWVVDLAPIERRGRVLGLYGLAVWGGLGIGPLIGSLVDSAAGYDAVWLLAALLPAAGALACLTAADRFVPLAHAEPHPLVAPEAIRPGIALGMATIGYATLAAFVILLLEERGLDGGAVVFAAFAGAIVVARLVLGDLPDRVRPAALATGAAIGEAAGLVAIALAGSLLAAVLGGVAMGVGFSLLNPALMVILVEDVSESARGAALGTFTALADAGVGVGAPLAGLVASLTNYEGAFIMAGGMALASAASIHLGLSRRRAEPVPSSDPSG